MTFNPGKRDPDVIVILEVVGGIVNVIKCTDLVHGTDTAWEVADLVLNISKLCQKGSKRDDKKKKHNQ